MYIDDCQHTFEDLAQTVLPGYMEKLRAALIKPYAASLFAEDKCGPATIAKKLDLAGDFSGCYVLLNGNVPFYVGISRVVLARLRQHVTGKSHYDASLVYAIARKRFSIKNKRSIDMANPEFNAAFVEEQLRLRSRFVAFIEITNPLELYIFEPYAAMSLGTHEWNTFRTH
jgi:hypothetical protein